MRTIIIKKTLFNCKVQFEFSSNKNNFTINSPTYVWLKTTFLNGKIPFQLSLQQFLLTIVVAANPIKFK